jgi:hypothetical protein
VKSHATNAARARLLFVACALALSAASAASVRAQGRNQRSGRIELATSTGSYPLTIDGQAPVGTNGMTSPTTQLIDLPPGQHTVEIKFPNNTLFRREFTILPGKKTCIALNFRPKTITIEHAVKVSPCPYQVNVSAPSSVSEGKTVTFSADVSYGGPSALNYTWTISPPTARIASGAGSPTITVDTTGVGNQRVTAILVVDDGSGDRQCRQRAQAYTNVAAIPPPPVPVAHKSTEFPSITFNEDKANFDNFAVELQSDPTAIGYIIVYHGHKSRPGRLATLVNRSRDYVVNSRNIDSNRVIVIDGGLRDVDTIELWIVPKGAAPPRPTSR